MRVSAFSSAWPEVRLRWEDSWKECWGSFSEALSSYDDAQMRQAGRRLAASLWASEFFLTPLPHLESGRVRGGLPFGRNVNTPHTQPLSPQRRGRGEGRQKSRLRRRLAAQRAVKGVLVDVGGRRAAPVDAGQRRRSLPVQLAQGRTTSVTWWRIFLRTLTLRNQGTLARIHGRLADHVVRSAVVDRPGPWFSTGDNTEKSCAE